MFTRIELVEIIGGKRTGLMPSLVRLVLGCATPIYRLAVGWRNWRYDRAVARQDQELIKCCSVPVISVGNLTVGGTGKTPLVIWIAEYLSQKKFQVALVSRGYGAAKNDNGLIENDEARELGHRLPGVTHLQDPDRFKMSQQAVEDFNAEVIVLDDGFQHRKLHRDLDLVLIDATCPFGYGRVLPRGLLREPLSSLRRADLIVLTRVDLVDDVQREKTIGRIRTQVKNIPVAEAQAVSRRLLRHDGSTLPVDDLKREKVFCFAAIGNPANFFLMLDQLGVSVVGKARFSDHHLFTDDDLESLAQQAKMAGASILACTHKDLVKIAKNQIGDLPVVAVLIEVEFLMGQEMLEQKIDAIFES